MTLSTKDGRQVRATDAGTEFPVTSKGRRRVELMLEDIGQAWAASGR